MKKRYQLIAMFVIFAVITYLDRNSFSALSDDFGKELGFTDIQLGLLFSAFSLAYGGFEIPTGIMVDKIGPRRTLFRIVVWWSVFTILTGLATSFSIGNITISSFSIGNIAVSSFSIGNIAISSFIFLLVVRFLFGAGEAGAFPTVSVTIARWFPHAERGSMQSVVWMGSRLGGALAPILSVALAAHYGWRSVFYIFGSLGVIWSIVWWFWFRDEPRDMKGISTEEIKEIEANRTIKDVSHKLLPLKTIIKNTNLWALMGMYHCLLYGAYFYMTWMPKYLQKGRGVSKEDTAWLTSVPFVLGMAGCIVGGFASDYFAKKRGLTFGRRYVGMFGLCMAGVCMIAGSFVQDITLCIILLGLGLAFKDFTLPVSWAAATDVGGKNAGAVSGSMGMAGQLGSVVMATAFAFILEKTGSYEIPVRIIGCIVILGGLLWFKIDASKPIEVE
jgi:MFS transporter, ACS family, glucarate transporter